MLRELPRELASHVADHRDYEHFEGRRVVIVGGGQSALESAAIMHEQGVDVEVLARQKQVFWLHGDGLIDSLGKAAPLFYAPTDVGPIGISRLVATPNVFRHFPRPAFDVIAARAIRPAGASWLKPRMADVPITAEHLRAGGDPVGRQALPAPVRRQQAPGGPPAVRHRLPGRRPPLPVPGQASSPRASTCVDGYPVLRPRHGVLGAAAALPRRPRGPLASAR